jgi:hypothetical protein
MNKWKIISILLAIALVLALLADNLLFVPKLVQSKSLKVGTCELDLPFDWYFYQKSGSSYLIYSVSEEKMIFAITPVEKFDRMDFNVLKKAICKEGECSFQYEISGEDVLEIKSPYGTSFALMDMFFLKSRKLEIDYMGDLADKYDAISYLISHSKIKNK